MSPRIYAYATSDKSRMAALVLCIFFGFFGAHQFYARKVFMGLIYLFTAGLFGIGVFIDFLRILLGSFKDDMGMPLRRW